MKVLLSCALLLAAVAGTLGQGTCPYFAGSRTPKAVTNLGNCTWYEDSSCCERAEVTSVFAEMSMFALVGSNKDCQNQINYMMCYFCDPRQSAWIRSVGGGVAKPVMCNGFCDSIIKECANAVFRGRTLGSVYPTGAAFCRANGFEVQTFSCLAFNASAFPSGASSIVPPGNSYTLTFFVLISLLLALI